MIGRLLGLSLVAAIGMAIGVQPASAASCESLASTALTSGKITSSSLVEAGSFIPPGGMGFALGGPGAPGPFKSLPAFCRVAATLTPTPDSDIKIEVWMPAQNWNGKLVGIGNGVWAGTIGYSAMAAPVAQGYATVATDTGHAGSGMDAGWAVGHREKLIDFGYRAIHEMTVNAKLLLAAYYGQKEKTALWFSCSTGGRQGLMEAYRYPEDYNGISAMAPANPMVGLMIGSLYTGYVAMQDPAHRLSRQNLAAVHKAFIAQCDEKDGLKDGIVANPQGCSFDPSVLQCEGQPNGDCLTATQLTTLHDIYAGPKNPETGAQIFPGFEPGSELQFGMLTMGTQPFPVATSYFRDLIFHNPKWDFKSYDYDKDLPLSYRDDGSILDVPSDGLAKFFSGGGKLLLSHGWSDGLIPAPSTVAFYKAMTAKMPPAEKESSVRLFMIPGMGHCGGGDAPTVTNMLSVINDWVETGKAPDSVIATNSPRQKPESRLLCPYPEYGRYKGTGNPADASSFTCEDK